MAPTQLAPEHDDSPVSGPQADEAYVAYMKERDEQIAAFFAAQDTGKNPDPQTLRDASGIRWEATTWEELVSLIHANTPQALAQLGRRLPDLKHYCGETQELKRRYVSMTDRLYEAVFKLPTARDEDQGGKLRAIVPPEFTFSQHIVFRKNDYPYWFEDGIEHYCLWATQPLSRPQLEEEIARHRGPELETVWFMNPTVLMSVPQFWHVHVLSRPAQAASQRPQ